MSARPGTATAQLCPRCGFANDQALEPAFCRQCGAPMVWGQCPDPACDDLLLGPELIHRNALIRLGPPHLLRDMVEIR